MLKSDQRDDLMRRVGAVNGTDARSTDAGAVVTLVETLVDTAEREAFANGMRLYRELDTLGRFIRRAKSEIAAIRPDDIQSQHLPTASDELDAIVKATEDATGQIMDAAERINERADALGATEIGEDVIKIFEACSFQDITGQRISKVVRVLKHIDEKVNALMGAFGEELRDGAVSAGEAIPLSAEEALLNGPQLPGAGINQADVDALFAR